MGSVSLYVAFQVIEGVDYTISEDKVEQTGARKGQIYDSFLVEFLEYLSQADVFSSVHRVCMHTTTANASSVYLDGFEYDAAEYEAARDAANTTLFCVEEREFPNTFKLNSSKIECSLDRENHISICKMLSENILVPVFKLDDYKQQSRDELVSLHIGRVFRAVHSLTILRLFSESAPNDLPQELFSWNRAHYMMLRNRKNFIYIIQNDVFCNTSHMRHKDAEVLLIAWKRKHRCDADCMFYPNSTVNEGRNAAWENTFVRWPGTVFTYYIFLDGDTSLTFRRERSSLSVVEGVSSDKQPFRMFEQYLLHYSPAIGLPRYDRWHSDNGNEVQLLSNFDHIMIAIHENVSRLFLPTETSFDDVSWWYGQRIVSLLAAVAFSNQTLQFNAVVTDNGSLGKKVTSLQGIKAPVCLVEPAQDFTGDKHEAAVTSKPCSSLFRFSLSAFFGLL